MGHAPATVAERHCTSTRLTKLRDAVESIKLDLVMPRVIALPVRMAASGEPLSERPQAAGLSAIFTPARGKTEGDVADSSMIFGTPGRTRTCDPRLRRPANGPKNTEKKGSWPIQCDTGVQGAASSSAETAPQAGRTRAEEGAERLGTDSQA